MKARLFFSLLPLIGLLGLHSATLQASLPKAGTLLDRPGFFAHDQQHYFTQHRPGHTLLVKNDRLLWQGQPGQPRYQLRFIGSNPKALLSGYAALPGVLHQFLGNDPTKWEKNLIQYQGLYVEQLYPGIDLHLHLKKDHAVEYDLIVHPHADATQIRMRWERLDEHSSPQALSRPPADTVNQSPPVGFQVINGKRHPVASHFMAHADHSQGIVLGDYRAETTLIIDPVLRYSSFLGDSQNDKGTAIAVDADGNAYVTGQTFSASFLTSTQTSKQGLSGDIFITKYNHDGDQILYSALLGGNGTDLSHSIAVDAVGNVYITGETRSADLPLSGLRGSSVVAQPQLSGPQDAFISKLDRNGELLFSTYLGGSDFEVGNAIAVDSKGDIYITGMTGSSNNPSDRKGPTVATTAFPVVPQGGGLRLTTARSLGLGSPVPYNGAVYGGGYSDAFVSKLTSDGSRWLYSSYLGGESPSPGQYNSLLSSTETNACIALWNTGPAGLAQMMKQRCWKLEQGNAIAVDSTGRAYVAGASSSPTAFPVSANSFQPACGQWDGQPDPNQSNCSGDVTRPAIGNVPEDGFLTIINPDGLQISYSTFIGGRGDDAVNALAIDEASGKVYLTGRTTSTDITNTLTKESFPTTRNSYKSVHNSATNANISLPTADAFLAVLLPQSKDVSDLQYGSYFGGSEDAASGTDGRDIAHAIALDKSGNVYIAGETRSQNIPHNLNNNNSLPNLDINISNGISSSIPALDNAFVAQFDLTQNGANALRYSTVIGGPNQDKGFGLAVDAWQNAYLTGSTNSAGPAFDGLRPGTGLFPTVNQINGKKLAIAGASNCGILNDCPQTGLTDAFVTVLTPSSDLSILADPIANGTPFNGVPYTATLNVTNSGREQMNGVVVRSNFVDSSGGGNTGSSNNRGNTANIPNNNSSANNIPGNNIPGNGIPGNNARAFPITFNPPATTAPIPSAGNGQNQNQNQNTQNGGQAVSNCTDVGNSTIDCTVDSIPANSVATVNFSFTPGQVGPMRFNYSLSSPHNHDRSTQDNSGFINKTVEQPADLRVTLTVNKSTVPAGGIVIYTMTAINDGPADSGEITANIQLASSKQVRFISASPVNECAATLRGVGVDCLFPNLKVGESHSWQIEVQLLQSGTRVENAIVNSSVKDTNPDNNAAETPLRVLGGADLELTATPKTIASGRYQIDISLRNQGPDAVDGIQLTASLPAGLQNANVSLREPNCTNKGAGQKIVCQFTDMFKGVMKAGESVSFNIQADANTIGKISYPLSVRANTQDPDTRNNDVTLVIDSTAIASRPGDSGSGGGGGMFGPSALGLLLLTRLMPALYRRRKRITMMR